MPDAVRRLILAVVMAIGLIPAMTGCGLILAGGAAAGTVAYIRGDLNAILDSPVKATITAVDAVVKKTGIIQISRSVDDLGATYILRTEQDDKIEINLSKANRTATEVVIRVGIFGDEILSLQILDEIKAQLK